MNTVGDRNLFTDLQSRLRALFRRNTVDRELDDELHFHFEQQVQKLVQSGVPETEARRQARLVFGGAEQIKEVCREARGTHLLETFLQDLRYAGRTLRKSPGFAITVDSHPGAWHRGHHCHVQRGARRHACAATIS